jgi:hypothetical protein
VGPAHSVDHARKLLAHQHVDAALLDVNLAGVRTDDLAATQAHDKVPSAFLTGYGRESLPVAFASAPLVPKPFMAKHVLGTVSELLVIEAASDPSRSIGEPSPDLK